MKKITCIVSDLDGTVVHDDNTISQETLNIIECVIASSIMFIVCTGRGYADLRSVFPKQIQFPCILLNGAMFMDAQGKIRKTCAMNLNHIQKIEHILLEQQMPCIYFTSKQIYGSGDLHSLSICAQTYYTDSNQQSYFNTSVIAVKSYKDIQEDILKLETMDVHIKRIEKIKAGICKIADIQVSSSLPFNIEITAMNVNKATMLQYVLDQHNVQKEEVLYFGDSLNDLDVFHKYPYVVAPSNASDIIKRKAYAVCASCEADGVAQYIKDNVLAIV